MKILSVAVGRPKDFEWRGEVVSSAIEKQRVTGPVTARRLNLDGDQQADLSVHGGPDKAIYAYPSEHYDFWRRELPEADLEWGAFGENLTTEGLLERDLRIGDRLQVGSCQLVVTQPRTPCYKLNVRFRRPDMVKRFLQSRFSGFYLAVVDEGQLTVGDTITLDRAPDSAVTVAEVSDLYLTRTPDRDLLRRAVSTAALPEGWRYHFEDLLQ